uniref:50S ribosomal protein L11 methyltransferase n=1 Tax=Alistipes sp. TaxID=1872444 RepID=UPI004056CA25
MDYVELNLHATADLAEILTAFLADYPFESFKQEGPILKAYIPQEKLVDCKEEVDALLARFGVEDVRYISIETQNWNALWESNFSPVDVEGRLYIRAPFHAPAPDGVMEVVIMPKMSFGTGHHATTCMVSSYLLDLDLKGKEGLDMGSGTGVLAIVAVKCGASQVDAVDIDTWADENCRENIAMNGVERQITPCLGDVRRIAGRTYDFIAANINRNILTGDMAAYVAAMRQGADLVMSGFLEADIPIIRQSAEEHGLRFCSSRLLNGWASVHCRRE